MQAYFAAGMLTAAAEAVNVERRSYDFGGFDFSNLFKDTFAVHYPTYDHAEE